MTANSNRLLSIDVMRGFTLFLMLFVNDLYVKGVPQWLLHTEAHVDGIGLADWVFPAFLFMVGISIPFAINNRLKLGHSNLKIIKHLVFRAMSLIFISLLIFNRNKLNPELTGMSSFVWSLCLYFCIFLTWNNYKLWGPKYLFLSLILSFIGFAMMVILAFKFKSGTAEDVRWLSRGWWGILGLIGWGYFIAAISVVWIKKSIWKSILLVVFFLILNILSSFDLLSFLNFLNPIFNVLIEGNIPFIILSGVVVGLLITKYKNDSIKLLLNLSIFAILYLVGAFVLRDWFIFSKIYATPSWGLLCTGLSLVVFCFFYIIIDIYKIRNGFSLFNYVGQNSLTTYIIPDVVYLVIWTYGFPLFFYKYLGEPIYCVLGSIVWAFLMMIFSSLLFKIKISLKL